ncbi:MAG: hypothetical protein CMO60_00375 [Verrucomicrobiales bacterium]|nr:hypothetical protein [Verrucomicrobiales bacterium]|tara:strand:+ start:89 stop:307 length:219 start_codon:yes stop_codon:yes gene_type:complete
MTAISRLALVIILLGAAQAETSASGVPDKFGLSSRHALCQQNLSFFKDEPMLKKARLSSQRIMQIKQREWQS